MLTSLEMDLVRRDPVLPGLAVVLDPVAFLTALREAAPGAELRAAKVIYLRYKPRSHCRVAYRLTLDHQELDLDVRACRREDLGPYLEDAKPCVAGPLGPGRLVLEPHAVALTAFPNDLSLPELQHLVNPVERRNVLRELLPAQPEFWQSDLRCLRYRPERRYVAELLSEQKSRAIVKAYTRKAYARGRHRAQVFESRPNLRVARLLGFADGRRLLAFEWLSGRLLTELWTEPQLACSGVTATGAALAVLHDQLPDGLDPWTPEATAADLAVVAGEVGFLCPHLAVRAETLARRMGARVMEAPGTPCCVHGDFSANQVLVSGQDAAIIDLDWAGYGDPADDLGNFLAQVERFALRGELAAHQVGSFRAALLEGYGKASKRPLPKRIGLYTAVQLFRRARFPFRTREPDWHQRMESLIDRAEAIFSRSSDESP